MILLKKTFRALLRHKKAYLSCVLLMAIGVWAYATMNTALNEISKGKDNYYDNNKLGDAFAQVKQVPKTAVAGLEDIPGIQRANGRVVQTIRVLLADHEEEILRLKLMSTPLDKEEARLNHYVVSEGKDLSGVNDVLIGADFYSAYDFSPDDSIDFLMDGCQYDFLVQGAIYSPEYVYIVENANELFSDTSKYNIAYMSEASLMSLYDMEGMYNDLAFELEAGYSFDDVESALADELKKYGLTRLYGREDLLSYAMLEEEIEGGESMSTSLPFIFISMAAVVLYLMLRRIIEQERTQIGTLKAFGYSDQRVLIHYINHGMLTGLAGGILGLLLSFFSIEPYIQFYLDYYKMPIGTQVTDYHYFIIAFIGSLAGGMVGAYFGARKQVHLKPAEAMRPKAPPDIHKDNKLLMVVLRPLLTSKGFMTIRNIARSKVRTAFVIIAIVFSYSMMVIIGMMTSLMDNMVFNQFNHVLKYDTEVQLSRPVDYDQGIQALLAYDQVTYSEGILKKPMALSNSYHKFGANVIGIPDQAQLYKVYDDTRQINLSPPEDGIILGSILADKLDVEVGDSISMASQAMAKEIKIYVKEIASQSLGASAYMDLDFLNELLGQEKKINSLLVMTHNSQQLREDLLTAEYVSKVESISKSQQLYEDLLGSFDFIIVIMQGLAIAISFTIIYNTAVISFSEKAREYATLRVLGMTIKEVKDIMSFEYWLLCFSGMVLGVPFSIYLNQGLVNMLDIETFSWPSRIPLEAFFMGALGTILAVAFSNRQSVKSIKNLNLVDVLKERE